MQQVVSMLVSIIIRKWFSRQQISYYMAIRATSSLLALVVDNDLGLCITCTEYCTGKRDY